MRNTVADNSLFDRLSDGWWSKDSFFHMLKTCANPWRIAFFRQVLDSNGLRPLGLRLLDVGCGGGLLSEEFARMGFAVTGVDRSEKSVAVAQQHARHSGLAIAYQTASAESLPFPDCSFDVAACCDVLEHISDWRTVLKEISRTLRPGGLLLYDTINRTAASRLLFIRAAQDWAITRIAPQNLHVWHMFISPQELVRSFAQVGLQQQAFHGARLSTGPFRTLSLVRRYKRGRLKADELGNQLRYVTSRSLSLSYAGYAMKRSPVPGQGNA